MKWRWAFVLLPVSVGLVLAILAGLGRFPNPTFYLRIDLGNLAIVAALFLSIIIAAALAVGNMRRSSAERMAEVHAQSTEDRRRFLQRLDHELKNPLTAIRAGLANIANEPAAEPQRETLASVEAQVIRLSRLTADLRKLADLETRALERAPVDVSELLSEAVALAQEEQATACQRQVTLTLPQAPWPLPSILGDWDLLFLAVYNLLSNALKFTDPGDRVEVRAFEDGANLVIEVADTGGGIPEAELPHVWQEL
jgi:two-component system OmpR family sensor kinase